MLLDSNIIIYSAQPKHAQLRELIAETALVHRLTFNPLAELPNRIHI